MLVVMQTQVPTVVVVEVVLAVQDLTELDQELLFMVVQDIICHLS